MMGWNAPKPVVRLLRLELTRLVPVHKRTFFRGVEGRRVGRLSAGARRFRVEVAAAAERIVWRAGVDRRIRLGRLSSKLPVGAGGYAGLRRASSTRLCATTADQM